MKQLQETVTRSAKIARGEECPECAETGGIEDNGCRAPHLSFCCSSCGEQWDAEYWLERSRDAEKV